MKEIVPEVPILAQAHHGRTVSMSLDIHQDEMQGNIWLLFHPTHTHLQLNPTKSPLDLNITGFFGCVFFYTDRGSVRTHFNLPPIMKGNAKLPRDQCQGIFLLYGKFGGVALICSSSTDSDLWVAL